MLLSVGWFIQTQLLTWTQTLSSGKKRVVWARAVSYQLVPSSIFFLKIWGCFVLHGQDTAVTFPSALPVSPVSSNTGHPQLPPCWEGRGESWNYRVEGGSVCHQGTFESRDGSTSPSCALPPTPCMVGSPRVVGAGRGWNHG